MSPQYLISMLESLRCVSGDFSWFTAPEGGSDNVFLGLGFVQLFTGRPKMVCYITVEDDVMLC